MVDARRSADDQGMVLAHAVANELRTRHILFADRRLIEKMCAIALTRAERETSEVDAGLTTRIEPPSIRFCWCVLVAVVAASPGPAAPGAPSANAVLAHLAAPTAVRALDFAG